MLWHIPSSNQEKGVTFSRPKGSLLTGIDKLKTTRGTESFLERILMQKKTYTIMKESNIFHKKWQKIK